MFDEHSFQEEITNPEEAEACTDYLAKNESKFRKELASEGLSYEEIEKEVATVWGNLIKSSVRVGFSNWTTEHKKKQFGIK